MKPSTLLSVFLSASFAVANPLLHPLASQSTADPAGDLASAIVKILSGADGTEGTTSDLLDHALGTFFGGDLNAQETADAVATILQHSQDFADAVATILNAIKN